MGDIDLTLVWAAIIGFAVFAYVVLDGFDLGIGMLFHCFPVGEERDKVMNTVAPVWDGNETWLVLGGGGLLALFPLAYAIILPATYPLIIIMLFGLILRGVAFEFRWRKESHRALWDVSFTLGSLLAAFCQGMILGAILQGIQVENRAYAGQWLDWMTLFSVLTGLSVMTGYILLGACWLIVKTEGETQDKARRIAYCAALATIACMVVVSLATPFLDINYWDRWFTMPGLLLTAPVPILVAVCSIVLVRSLRKKAEHTPFLMGLALFLLGYIGLIISIYPYMIPRSVTIWDAATSHSGQAFMLPGALFIVPMILTYTAWSYWVFRGKVKAEGYH